MTIAIGSDHGGYELKLEVIKHLKDRGFEVTITAVTAQHPATTQSMERLLQRQSPPASRIWVFSSAVPVSV